MDAPDPKMIRLLKRHHVLSLATCRNNIPWVASCFYVFDQEKTSFLFTSDKETRHISEGLLCADVSGAIALETKVIGKIRGMQFSGHLSECIGEDHIRAKKLYLKRFPYALPFIGATALWQIEITYLKMTDNRLGFGKKLIWCKKS
jgi:uncharacterized protein YhbP (UPF0306 family)